MGLDPEFATGAEIVEFERHAIATADPESVFPAAADEPLIVGEQDTTEFQRITLFLPRDTYHGW